MTKEEKFQIGMALNKIAMSLSDEDFHKVKGYLKDIEKIVAEQTEPYEYEIKALHKDYVEPYVVIEQTEPSLVKDSSSLVKDLVKAFCEDGTWLERQGVYTLTLAEAKQRAVDIIESVAEPTTGDCSMVEQTEPKCAKCIWLNKNNTANQCGNCVDGSMYSPKIDNTDCPWK